MKLKFQKLARFWLPPILWSMVIFLFSSLPTKQTTEVYVLDFIVKKTAHVVEYGLFTTLFYRAFINSGIKKRSAIVLSVILAVLYGISDEFHQSFTPGREPRLRDVGFDTIGSVLAIWLITKKLPKAPKKLKTWAKDWQLI